MGDFVLIQSIPELIYIIMINSKNWHILDDLNTTSISRLDKTLNILEYVNFCYICHYDKNQYKIISDSTQYQEDIKVCVYSHTYICEYSDIYIYAYPHMSNPEIVQECGLTLPGIMTDCKNFFRARAILRFVECKNCFNLFLFFDGVQGQNKLTLDNGIIIVYNVGNNQSRRLKWIDIKLYHQEFGSIPTAGPPAFTGLALGTVKQIAITGLSWYVDGLSTT